MNNFIKYFWKYEWNFEFILSNKNELNKILFLFEKNSPNIIINYINNNIKLEKNILDIFNLYWLKINHIWYDEKNNRYKFYIWLYNDNFRDSLKIIKNCKDILWIKEKYFLEKDFYKFDCIWFDISENWIDMKIYELIKKENHYDWLPNFIDKENIKEIWYLKNFKLRKKKFFRFEKKLDIWLFKKDFNIESIDIFKNNIKDIIFLEKKVKYYCIEWKKKEIYFL